MAAPVQPMNNSVSLDEIEQQMAPPAIQPDVATLKLDGQGIPEQYQGKTVAELIQMQEQLAQSLKLSEHGRILAQQAAQAPVAAAPAAPAEPAPLTDEELAELHANEPVKAIRYMQDQAVRAATRNFEARIAPMMQGSSSSAENAARAAYPEEFAALGSEISAMIQTLPNKGVLTDPAAWDQLIGYVRGQKGNFEKFIAFKDSKKAGANLSAARQAQEAGAGMSFAPSYAAPTVWVAMQSLMTTLVRLRRISI
jgi:hypothetical protein